MKKDVSGRRKAENELQKLNEELERLVLERTAEVVESERKYRNMIETSLVGVYATTMDGKILYVNDAIVRMMEAGSVEEVTALSMLAMYKNPGHRNDLVRQLQENGFVADFKSEMMTTKGNVITVLLSAKLENNTISGMILDITERKKAEEEIKKANRVYAVLSNINQTIVRVNDKQTLYDEACRIAVEDGKFKMAWIGIHEQETNKVRAAAAAGNEADYLKTINLDLNVEKYKQCPAGQAIISGNHFIENDLAENQKAAPWRENSVRLGYKSVAAFPIKAFGSVVGAFALYNESGSFFDEVEIKLLDELAMDISFAIEFLENDVKRKQYEEQLKYSEEHLRSTLDNMIEGCQIIGHDWEYIYINKEAEKHNQRPNEELLGNRYMDMWPGIETTEVFNKIKRCLEEKENYRMENEFVFPDGRPGWFQLGIQSVSEGVLILSNDISEVKLAETKAIKATARFKNLVASLNDVVWTASIDGSELIDVNHSFENIYGITFDKYKANPKLWIEMVHPDDRPIAEASGKELYKKGITQAEYRIVKPDGTIVWLLDRKSLIYYYMTKRSTKSFNSAINWFEFCAVGIPVPSVFVVDTSGKILFEYINPDYKTRLSAGLLLAVLKELKNERK